MNYYVSGKDIILYEKYLSLDETLDCGQAFRWEKISSDENITKYRGFFKNYPLTVSQEGADKFIFHDVSENEFLSVWADYFDLYTDYGEIINRLSEDEALSAACKFAPGIRILKQNSDECIISFILSQNNNIPRIKGIIGRLCEMFGGFPDFSQLKGLSVEDFSPLRAGFRAKYIVDCAERFNNGSLDVNILTQMSTAEAEKALMTVKGIGPKVAKCILLFGMHKLDAYPVDVWIKRVNEKFYPNGLPECTRGIEGIAQQYLFYYIRSTSERK